MQLIKFLQNSSQAFLNVKHSLHLLMDMILNFQQKLLKENAGQRTQLTCRKLGLLIGKNFQHHFKVIFGIRTIKPTWCETIFLKIERNPAKVLTSFQTNYLAFFVLICVFVLFVRAKKRKQKKEKSPNNVDVLNTDVPTTRFM